MSAVEHCTDRVFQEMSFLYFAPPPSNMPSSLLHTWVVKSVLRKAVYILYTFITFTADFKASFFIICSCFVAQETEVLIVLVAKIISAEDNSFLPVITRNDVNK